MSCVGRAKAIPCATAARRHGVVSGVQVLLVADDLTGAIDAAAAFTRAGLSARVMLRATPVIAASADVVALNMATRDAGAAAAVVAARRMVGFIPDDAACHVFRKVDSLLRGSWAAEIAATVREMRSRRRERVVAIVAPTLPDHGRTVRDGRSHVTARVSGGEALTDARAGGVDLLAALRAEGMSSAALGLLDVRSSAPEIEERIGAVIGEGADAVVFDALTDDDLAAVARAAARALSRRGVMPLWVGSAGLAAQLPGALNLARRQTADRHIAVPGPLFAVIGSQSAMAREQHRRLADMDGVTGLVVPPSLLVEGSTHADWAKTHALADAALRRRAAVALAVSDDTAHRYQPSSLTEGLAAFVKPYLDRLGSIFVSGGHTAEALLAQMDVEELAVEGELEAGVVLTRPMRPAQQISIVTKAGSFGDPDSLVRLHSRLTSTRDPS